MSALDQCHNQVVRALQKDGWVVDPKPARLYADERRAIVDIRASKNANGSREQILFVEVKCFPDPKDTTRDLYTAIGQYIIYRTMIINSPNPVPLYLAVPEPIFLNVFDEIVLQAIREIRIKLVIVSLESETIVQWIT